MTCPHPMNSFKYHHSVQKVPIKTTPGEFLKRPAIVAGGVIFDPPPPYAAIFTKRGDKQYF